VIENAQRDINIAFMNEVARIFCKADISIWDVLEAARTKWNFLNFSPGLVGGHCIGVDQYYLSHLAQQLDHEPRVILAGREINDGMGAWISGEVDGKLDPQPARILVLGVTFKENVPDVRNSKVVDIVKDLQGRGHDVSVHDPFADVEETEREYGIRLRQDALDHQYDAVVCAVAHDEYAGMDEAAIEQLLVANGLIADLKGTWRHRQWAAPLAYWTL
jgi:UDP-N-acetyl-D-galactosamine dehydrogenase